MGHRETSPLLTQENLDRHHTEDTQLSLVLFDEIEKASDSLWQLSSAKLIPTARPGWKEPTAQPNRC